MLFQAQKREAIYGTDCKLIILVCDDVTNNKSDNGDWRQTKHQNIDNITSLGQVSRQKHWNGGTHHRGKNI